MNALSFQYSNEEQEQRFLETIHSLRFLEGCFFDILFALKEKKLNETPLYREVFAIIQDIKNYRNVLTQGENRNESDSIVEIYNQEFVYIKEKFDLVIKGNQPIWTEKTNVTSIQDYKTRLAIYQKQVVLGAEKELAKERRRWLLKYFYTTARWDFLTISEQNSVREKVDTLIASWKWEQSEQIDHTYQRDIRALKISKVPNIFLEKDLSVEHIQGIRKFLNDPNIGRLEKAQISHDLRKVYWTRALNDAIYLWKEEYIDVFSPEFDFFRITNIASYSNVKNNYARIEVSLRKKWEPITQKKTFFTDLTEFVRWSKIKFHNHDWEYCEKLSLIDFKKHENTAKNTQKSISNWVIPQEEKKWFLSKISNVKNKVTSFFKNIF